MFRLIGFLVGTVLFLALAIQEIPGQVYWWICFFFCLCIVLLLVLFRVAAKYLNGFWRIWSRRLQRWISNAILCMSQYTQMPDYQDVINPSQNKEPKVTLHNNIKSPVLLAIVEFFVCFAVTIIAPVLLGFVFFCFGEAIYYECKYQDEKKQRKEKRNSIVARQSARMSLEMPLMVTSPSRKSTEEAVNYIVDLTQTDQIQLRKSQVQSIKEVKAQDEVEEEVVEQKQQSFKESIEQTPKPEQATLNQRNTQSSPQIEEEQQQIGEKVLRNQGHMSKNINIHLPISIITEESRDYYQSGDYQHIPDRGSVPRYKPQLRKQRSNLTQTARGDNIDNL